MSAFAPLYGRVHTWTLLEVFACIQRSCLSQQVFDPRGKRLGKGQRPPLTVMTLPSRTSLLTALSNLQM